ncbi:YecA family protein [Bacillus sp. Marseille-Q3570]|uniref:YecA family protein n=1 Tax=Bacillus sp. Marseille-Q3570 TaxID=2963522 RepID=UPI0021B6F053|nr:SEC-C domain-containing protein [Bacillus sp. Marseille-Q3570]
MKTVGRNDLCPCGSGKKYKKCCLENDDNVIDFFHEKKQREFFKLYNKLMEYTVLENESLKDLLYERIDIPSFDKEHTQYILEASYSWSTFHMPVSGEETPAELFLKNTRLSNEERETVEEWLQSKPSLYRIENHANNQCTLVDPIKPEEKHVAVLENIPDGPPMDGYYLVGALLPFKEKLFINGPPIFVPFQVIGELTEKICSIDHQLPPQINLVEHFPEIIQEGFKLMYGLEQLDEFDDYDEDLTPLEAEVWECFERNTVEMFSDEEMCVFYKLWVDYCSYTFPQITKPESYAAGLEYVAHTYFEERQVTQKEIAKKYGVTAPTISTRSRSFIEFMEEIKPEIEDNPSLLEDLDGEFDIEEQAGFFFDIMIKEQEKLGQNFINENKGHLWMVMEARPYMTAKFNYAECELELEERDFALDLLRELLEENPMDNQGVRYVLLPNLIEEGLYEEARELIKEYDEVTANFAFNKALLEYKETRNFGKTLELLKEADSVNPHVKEFMLDRKEIPPEPPMYIGMGDENEAIDYVMNHFEIWMEEEPLIALLAQVE